MDCKHYWTFADRSRCYHSLEEIIPCPYALVEGRIDDTNIIATARCRYYSTGCKWVVRYNGTTTNTYTDSRIVAGPFDTRAEAESVYTNTRNTLITPEDCLFPYKRAIVMGEVVNTLKEKAKEALGEEATEADIQTEVCNNLKTALTEEFVGDPTAIDYNIKLAESDDQLGEVITGVDDPVVDTDTPPANEYLTQVSVTGKPNTYTVAPDITPTASTDLGSTRRYTVPRGSTKAYYIKTGVYYYIGTTYISPPTHTITNNTTEKVKFADFPVTGEYNWVEEKYVTEAMAEIKDIQSNTTVRFTVNPKQYAVNINSVDGYGCNVKIEKNIHIGNNKDMVMKFFRGSRYPGSGWGDLNDWNFANLKRTCGEVGKYTAFDGRSYEGTEDIVKEINGVKYWYKRTYVAYTKCTGYKLIKPNGEEVTGKVNTFTFEPPVIPGQYTLYFLYKQEMTSYHDEYIGKVNK